MIGVIGVLITGLLTSIISSGYEVSITTILIILLLTSTTSLIFACEQSKKAPENVNVSTSSGLFIAKEPLDKAISNQSTIRSRTVTVETANLFKRLTTEQLTTLSLNFFDNAVFNVVRQKQMINESGSITWMGKLPSDTGSIAILNVSKDRIDGSLAIPNKGLFVVRQQLDGTHLVEEIDRSAIQ